MNFQGEWRRSLAFGAQHLAISVQDEVVFQIAADVGIATGEHHAAELIRSIEQPWVHNVRPGTSSHLASPTDISSEERDEIRQLCRRVNEIEQEIKRLTVIRAHLKYDQIFQLPYDDLVLYGFEAGFEVD